MNTSRSDGNCWNWSSGRNRYYSTLVEEDDGRKGGYNDGYQRQHNLDGVPVYFEDQDDETDSRSMRSRSPIQKICRAFVEEGKPGRNFGNYDPVQSLPTRPVSAMMRSCTRTAIPIKLENRRVLYRGITEKGGSSSERYRLSHFGNEEREIVRREDYGYPDLVNLDTETFHRTVKPENFDRFKFEEQFERKEAGISIPISRSQYQVPTKLPTYASQTKLYLPQTNSLSVSSRRTMDIRRENPNTLTPQYRSSGFKNCYQPPTQASTPPQPQSSWMAFTEGTGFFQRQASANIDANRRHQVTTANNESVSLEKDKCTSVATESKPTFKYGYTTGRQAASSNDKLVEPGRCETLFCEKVYSRDLFYKLRRLPDYEIYGTIYYSYEIEFWPFGNHAFKETVSGHQMEDDLAAKDSVFSAALKKLDSLTLDTSTSRSENVIVKTESVKMRQPIHYEESEWKRVPPQESRRTEAVTQPAARNRTRVVLQEPCRTSGALQERVVSQDTGLTQGREGLRASGITRTVLQEPGLIRGREGLRGSGEIRTVLQDPEMTRGPEGLRASGITRTVLQEPGMTRGREGLRDSSGASRTVLQEPGMTRGREGLRDSSGASRTVLQEPGMTRGREGLRDFSGGTRTVLQEPGMTRGREGLRESSYETRTVLQEPEKVSIPKKEPESDKDNYRIAIPRGPSIVWDHKFMRHNYQNRVKKYR